MGNVFDYMKEYGDRTFEEFPFCEVDALILAQMSYLGFDGVVPALSEKGETVSLLEIDEAMDPDRVFYFKTYERQNRELWKLLLLGRRFCNMRCSGYQSLLDVGKEMQFGAITFFPEGAKPVVAFRGTDGTIVGWKEDFNMAFKHHVPAQQQSVAYLNRAGALLDGDFLVCGHSKGGNLAIYGSAMAEPEIKERIAEVYSLDGPGFLPEMLPEKDYAGIRGRVRRILPVSSLVGMMLQNYEDYEVVKSTAFGVQQHDCYTWQVGDGALVKAREIEAKRRRMDEVLNQWIFALSEDERELMVDSLFEMLEGTGATTLTEFAADWKENMKSCMKYMRSLDPDMRKKLRGFLKMLFEIYGSVTGEAIRQELSR